VLAGELGLLQYRHSRNAIHKYSIDEPIHSGGVMDLTDLKTMPPARRDGNLFCYA
jgi:hypothetical protein